MNGRIALVTGAGSGLGAAITRRLAADGAHLIVNDLNADAAAKVAADVGGEAAPFDVTDSRAFTAAVDAAVERHGRIDVLVNNAGIVHDRPEVRARSMANMAARMEGRDIEPVSATSTLTDEQWDLMIKTHLYGTFYGTRAALRHMEPVRSGAIVNLASIYGIVGSAGTADYSAAKGAIVLFTKSVGREVAPLGIRVNAVAPGFIDTPLLAPMADMRGMLEMQIPSGAARRGRGGREPGALPRRRRGQLLLRRRADPHRRLLDLTMPTLFSRIIEGEIPGTFVWRDDLRRRVHVDQPAQHRPHARRAPRRDRPLARPRHCRRAAPHGRVAVRRRARSRRRSTRRASR